jgi:putative oxidoreductase
MSEGILFLRLVLGLVLLAHAGQKAFGWFQGRGLSTMAEAFSSLGLQPGRVFVIVASVTEVLAAVSLLLGLLVPLGAAAATGAMLVAGVTMQLSAGRFWNAAGGGEYPYFIAAAAVAVAFTGGGAYSLDAVVGGWWPAYLQVTSGSPAVGSLVVIVAAAGAFPFVMVIRRSRARAAR